MQQQHTGAQKALQEHQSPELVRLFETYTAGPGSIGARLTALAAARGADAPLVVATGADFILWPGADRPPEVEGYRLSTRGFKELAAVSHLGPAVASLVHLRALDPHGTLWRDEAARLLDATRAARAASTTALWRDRIAVPAYAGREEAIARMTRHACITTERYLERALAQPGTLTPEDLRERYLEAAHGDAVPMNRVMIATFFLVGLDTAHRAIAWFDRHPVDWSRAMAVIVGRQGRPTAGVTWSTNAVCAYLQAAARGRLAPDRIYIAPHAPAPDIARPVDAAQLRGFETAMRQLWWYTRTMADLGPTMYAGYPRFVAGAGERPLLTPATTEVAEMPAVRHPADWETFNTRMRLILEDPRQLLAGCVVDYAAEQLQACGNDPVRVVVPGLDNTDYPND